MTTTRIRHLLGALAVAPLMATAPATGAASAPDRPGAAPAQATAPAPCPRGRGVTVVVDFGSSRRTGCAPGDPRSGLDALRAAGFATVMVARFPGMVCRINGLPKPAVDACVIPPPPTRYWSYWHATRGGKWTYSSGGAGTYDPKPGTVDGWAYGPGKPPSVPPPARVAADGAGPGR